MKQSEIPFLSEPNITETMYVKDAHKHTSCLHELSKDEIWLGNTGTEIPEEYKNLKTIRIGEQAYCIKGKPLQRNYCRPLIINKSEEAEYNRIYLEQMFEN